MVLQIGGVSEPTTGTASPAGVSFNPSPLETPDVAGDRSLFARLRQPEYTGENRCLPCTVLNVTIASVGTSLLVAWLTAAGYQRLALLGGTAVLAASLGSVWLRGYLVPRTPALTERSLPASVLAAFGKPPEWSPQRVAADGTDTDATDGEVPNTTDGPRKGQPVDVADLLARAGAIEPCRGDDRCLTDGFATAWETETEAVRAAADPTTWLEHLGLDRGAVETEETPGAFAVSVDGRRVGRWESEPAFEADLSAAALLADRVESWGTMDGQTREQLCNGLRTFLEACPGCGGPVSFETETVESCCASHTVAAASCEDCGARVFESPVDEGQASA